MIRPPLLSLLCAFAIGLVGCDAVAPADAPSGTSVAAAETANSLAAPTLTSTHNSNLRIDLSWNAVSGATSYTVYRVNTGYDGTLADGANAVGSATSAVDYPYFEPDYDTFVLGQAGFACYYVKAHGSGQTSQSNTVCYGVGNDTGNGGGGTGGGGGGGTIMD